MKLYTRVQVIGTNLAALAMIALAIYSMPYAFAAEYLGKAVTMLDRAFALMGSFLLICLAIFAKSARARRWFENL